LFDKKTQNTFGALVMTDVNSNDSKINAAKIASDQRRASQIANSAINLDLRFDETVKKHNSQNIERVLREQEKLSGLQSALITASLSPNKTKNSQTIPIEGLVPKKSDVHDNRNKASSKDTLSDTDPVPSDQSLAIELLDHDSASDKGFIKSLEGSKFRDSFESLLSRDEDNINTHRSEKKNDDGRGEEGVVVVVASRKDSSDSVIIPEVALQYLEALENDTEVSSITSLGHSLRHPSRQNLIIKPTSMPSLESPPPLNSNVSIISNSPKRVYSPDGSLRTPSLDPPKATALVMPVVHHTNKSKNKKILHKSSYIDEQGKLQGEDFVIEKNLFETLRDTDLVLDPPPDFNAMKLQHKDTALIAIKHPYLSLPGVKPVKYPKEMSSTTSVRQPYSIDTLHSQYSRMVNAPQLNMQTIADTSIDNLNKKQASQQLKTIAENADDIAVAEPVFLGNSSAYIVSTDAYSSYARRTKSAPWLPNGSLEPMETNRSNKRLGIQEKFDLLRYSPHDPSKQIMMIKGQEAARIAFESFVGTHIH